LNVCANEVDPNREVRRSGEDTSIGDEGASLMMTTGDSDIDNEGVKVGLRTEEYLKFSHCCILFLATSYRVYQSIEVVMPRIPRQIAFNLIQYVKKVEVSANIWHDSATSALEFHRQMTSKRLKKINPEYDCNLILHSREEDSIIKVSFSDGTVWETSTAEYKCSDLRGEVYMRAEGIEEDIERSEADDVSGGYGEEDYGETGRVIKHVKPLEDSIRSGDDDKDDKKGGAAKKAPEKKPAAKK
jgi:hypothetical protein